MGRNRRMPENLSLKTLIMPPAAHNATKAASYSNVSEKDSDDTTTSSFRLMTSETYSIYRGLTVDSIRTTVFR